MSLKKKQKTVETLETKQSLETSQVIYSNLSAPWK